MIVYVILFAVVIVPATLLKWKSANKMKAVKVDTFKIETYKIGK